MFLCALKMAEGHRSVDDIITRFLLNTTRIRPRLAKHAVTAASFCSISAVSCCSIRTKGHPADDESEGNVIPLTTGSAAEFYIEPIFQPFIGDVDVMNHQITELAIPRGQSPPSQLPSEFHNYATVYEIIDSQFPGYLYLELRYLLTQCSDDDTYNAVGYDRGLYKSADSFGTNCSKFAEYTQCQINSHGPARQFCAKGYVTLDKVRCVRCLLWPTQAADWPTRHRNYKWPDSATVDRVVSNGCDLVQVAHPKYRQHEVFGKCQWRLSFSRAEIVLMNSWMPLQQIVYHLLRVFLKTERLTESADNSGSGTLSNYHIKTLTLWACELKPRSWWTDDISFTAKCADLLHLFSQWLNQGYCPHYFMVYCNLFDPCDRANHILAADRLSEINQAYVMKWFLGSYLPACLTRCPSNISRMFDDVIGGESVSSDKLQRAVSAVVDWRRNNALHESWHGLESATNSLSAQISECSLTARSYLVYMKELSKLDTKLSVNLIAVARLHVALNISRHGFSDRWTKLLPILFDDLGCENNLINSKNTLELIEFLQKSAIDRLTTFRQLAARDFGSVVPIATADFEAMYAYKRGDYQHCLQLSGQNLCTQACASEMTDVPLFPEFLQLLDDDIISLTALQMIVNRDCRVSCEYSVITQVTLSLYLATQCLLKLRYSVTLLSWTLDYIETTMKRHPLWRTLDQLTLKLAERKIVAHIS